MVRYSILCDTCCGMRGSSGCMHHAPQTPWGTRGCEACSSILVAPCFPSSSTSFALSCKFEQRTLSTTCASCICTSTAPAQHILHSIPQCRAYQCKSCTSCSCILSPLCQQTSAGLCEPGRTDDGRCQSTVFDWNQCGLGTAQGDCWARHSRHGCNALRKSESLSKRLQTSGTCGTYSVM